MKQVYLDTFGCQMNVADTDRMELVLFHSGYRRTLEKEDADLILVNTCSIREKAEQKTFSLFGGLKPLKMANPDLILGLTGCQKVRLFHGLVTIQKVKAASPRQCSRGHDFMASLRALLEPKSYLRKLVRL